MWGSRSEQSAMGKCTADSFKAHKGWQTKIQPFAIALNNPKHVKHGRFGGSDASLSACSAPSLCSFSWNHTQKFLSSRFLSTRHSYGNNSTNIHTHAHTPHADPHRSSGVYMNKYAHGGSTFTLSGWKHFHGVIGCSPGCFTASRSSLKQDQVSLLNICRLHELSLDTGHFIDPHPSKYLPDLSQWVVAHLKKHVYTRSQWWIF